MENVFVIKVQQVMNDAVIVPPSKWCDCVDRDLGHADPDCLSCGGSGVIKYPSTFSVDQETSTKKLTKADIVFENDPMWDGEDDEAPISDIMAYFAVNEDVEPGNQIMHKGKLYWIISKRVVVDIDNIQRLECALEKASQ